MRAPKVSIVSKIKDPVTGKWSWSRPVVTQNRIKHIPGACYYLRVNGKPEPAGNDPDLAYVAFQKRQISILAQATGMKLPETVKNRLTIDEAVEKFLAKHRDPDISAPTTLAVYERSIELFRLACCKNKAYLDEITREDLVDHFSSFMRKNYAERTAHNRFGNILSFLKKNGLRFSPPIEQQEWPELIERDPEAYKPDELNKLFAACKTQRERLVLISFLVTGFRDGEVSHMTYSDFDENKVRVRAKPRYGWFPKTKQSLRCVSVDPAYVKEIAEWQKIHPNDDLVFPNRSGGPDTHFIDLLKRVAKRAGITGRVDLHKFRATAATRWSGGKSRFTIQNIQNWLGHKDVETTMRYLAIEDPDSPEVQEKIKEANADLNLFTQA
jgi:integrase